MKTCTVTAQAFLGDACEYGGKPNEVREWKGVDIMKTSHTRAWVTRKFNQLWASRRKDERVRVEWECWHDDGSYRFSGALSGVNGIKRRIGVFEY